MPEYSIRPVSKEELDACAKVVRKSFSTVALEFGLTMENCPTNGAFTRTEHLHSDLNRGASLYGLFGDGVLAGFFELKRRDDGSIELEKLCVLPDHRHGGCGKMMLQHAGAEALKMGGKKITIGIIEGNARLKTWYMRHGFVPIRTASFPKLPFVVGFMEWTI